MKREKMTLKDAYAYVKSKRTIIRPNQGFLKCLMKLDVPLFMITGNGLFLDVLGAKGNNLKKIDVSFPLGVFTCVTGVSGGGKSTLVIETLFKSVALNLNGSRVNPAEVREINGIKYLDKVIDIDQSPIGRTPRSNPATYTGAFAPINQITGLMFF